MIRGTFFFWLEDRAFGGYAAATIGVSGIPRDGLAIEGEIKVDLQRRLGSSTISCRVGELCARAVQR